jgi:hypothetical protein
MLMLRQKLLCCFGVPQGKIDQGPKERHVRVDSW